MRSQRRDWTIQSWMEGPLSQVPKSLLLTSKKLLEGCGEQVLQKTSKVSALILINLFTSTSCISLSSGYCLPFYLVDFPWMDIGKARRYRKQCNWYDGIYPDSDQEREKWKESGKRLRALLVYWLITSLLSSWFINPQQYLKFSNNSV